MQSVALLWFRGCVLECIMGPRDTSKSPPKFTNQKRRIPNKFPNIIAAGVGLPIMSHNLHVYKLLDRRHVTISYLFVGHKNRNNTACPETLELWSRLNALDTFASDSLFPHLNCTQDWMGLLHVIAVIITRRKYWRWSAICNQRSLLTGEFAGPYFIILTATIRLHFNYCKSPFNDSEMGRSLGVFQ